MVYELQIFVHTHIFASAVVPYISRTQITFLFVYEPGDTIRMDCPAIGTPAPTIKWFSHTLNQSVTDLINSTRLRFFPNGSLEIRDLAPDDEALYRCEATNSVGKDIIYPLVINLEAYRFCKLSRLWDFHKVGVMVLEVVQHAK